MKTAQFLILPLLLSLAPSISAGLVVSSYSAVASTNAFAPLDKSTYFDEHFLENTSAAIVDAAGDWTGTNFNGSVDTWRWVGSAHTEISTIITPSNLNISGNGNFGWGFTSTANFVSPSSQTVLYIPGGATSYGCAFVLDTPATFSLQSVLSRFGSIEIYSPSTSTTIYSKTNNSNQPFLASLAGTLPAGEYAISVGAGASGVGNSGASDVTRAGSFTNFNFTVSVPEPSLLGAFGFSALLLQRRR